jgi:hypothetical protein
MYNQRDRYEQESQYRPDPRDDRERYMGRDRNLGRSEYEDRGANRGGSDYGNYRSSEWQADYGRNDRRELDPSRRYGGDEGWGARRSDSRSEHQLSSNVDANMGTWSRNDRDNRSQGWSGQPSSGFYGSDGGRDWTLNRYQGDDQSGLYQPSGDRQGRSWESRPDMTRGNSGGQSQSRGMHVGRGPKGYRRSDERISEDVNEALSQNGEVDASEIEVKVQNGEVILSGTVDDRSSKRRAEEIAESCSGVQDVRNEIRVQKSGSESSSATQGKNKTTNGATKSGESKTS